MKEKYLIFNEENKILTFSYKTDSEFNLMFIPSKQLEDKFKHGIEVLDILNKKEDDLVYLANIKKVKKYYKHQNNKLIVQEKIRNKIYYGLYHEFTNEEIYEIIKKCHEENTEPYFLTLEEITKIVADEIDRIRMDSDLKEPIKVLTKKLNYQEY